MASEVIKKGCWIEFRIYWSTTTPEHPLNSSMTLLDQLELKSLYSLTNLISYLHVTIQDESSLTGSPLIRQNQFKDSGKILGKIWLNMFRVSSEEE